MGVTQLFHFMTSHSHSTLSQLRFFPVMRRIEVLGVVGGGRIFVSNVGYLLAFSGSGREVVPIFKCFMVSRVFPIYQCRVERRDASFLRSMEVIQVSSLLVGHLLNVFIVTMDMQVDCVVIDRVGSAIFLSDYDGHGFTIRRIPFFRRLFDHTDGRNFFNHLMFTWLSCDVESRVRTFVSLMGHIIRCFLRNKSGPIGHFRFDECTVCSR